MGADITMTNDHIHEWHTFKNDMLMCDCDTVIGLSDLLDKTIKEAEKRSKLELLSKQLFSRSLKKTAHDAAYNWVKRNSPESIKPAVKQEVLL